MSALPASREPGGIAGPEGVIKALGEPFGEAAEFGNPHIGGEERSLEFAFGGKAAAEIEIVDGNAKGLLDIVTEPDQLLGQGLVGLGVQDESTDVTVQPIEAKPPPLFNAPNHIHGLPGFQIETEAAPLGIDAGIQVEADTHRDLPIQLIGHRFEIIDLIQVIYMNLGFLPYGLPERGQGFVGTIENNIPSGNTQAARLIIFHLGDYLGDAAFLMEDGVDGVQPLVL